MHSSLFSYQRRIKENRLMHNNYIEALNICVFQPIHKFVHHVRESRFVVHLIGKFRRFYLIHFRQDYVRKQQLLRNGACRQCGECCCLVFKCPLLTRKGLCLIYGKCRPDVCKIYPIDQRDVYEVNAFGGHCGYWFEEERLSFRTAESAKQPKAGNKD